MRFGKKNVRKNREAKERIAECLQEYGQHLREEEKKEGTISQYVRQVGEFLEYGRKYAPEPELTKCFVKRYKDEKMEMHRVSTVNTVVASLNSFFRYINRTDLKLKSLARQQKVFQAQEKELTLEEMNRLVEAARVRADDQLALVIQTLVGTGIRVSELKYITVEAVKQGQAEVTLKRKTRIILLPDNLMDYLGKYAGEQGIRSGVIFTGKDGKPLDRTYIWRSMKKLSASANVAPEKIYPHNLRHLFARSFYENNKDIVKLAGVLGHSSINTTRLYTLTTCEEHRKCLNELGLVA